MAPNADVFSTGLARRETGAAEVSAAKKWRAANDPFAMQ
jgi:hypothetical protein